MTSSSTTITTVYKVVLDTNMILSGSFFGGMVEIIIDLITDNKLRLFVSIDLIQEVNKKLKEFQASEEMSRKIMKVLKKGIRITPNIKVKISRDPKDNFLLELSETASVDYLITRDKDLLDLPGRVWKNTKIIKPEAFLPFLRNQGLI